jgi:hypothetical protein
MRIFGPKREEVTGRRIKLHNRVLNNSYSSLDIITIIRLRQMKWAGTCSETRNTYKILIGKFEGNRPFGRPRTDERIILR